MQTKCTVAYLLGARTTEQVKQSLLGNGFVTGNNGVAVGSGVFCAIGTATRTRESI
jgi:hypothetical protein